MNTKTGLNRREKRWLAQVIKYGHCFFGNKIFGVDQASKVIKPHYILQALMPEKPEDTIWIVTDDTPKITIRDGTKGGIGRGDDWGDETETTGSKGVGDAVKVNVEKLEQEMSHFLQVVGQMFHRAEQQVNAKSGIQLDEIELAVEISGEGEVKLIGNGAKAGGKGAIKLKFKRVEPK